MTGPLYCGAIFTAVCTREQVAPPISSGVWRLRKYSSLSISPATYCISSRLGVIRPDRPTMSAFTSLALARISCKYEQDARRLLEYVGGKENIAAVSHCVSR